MTNRATPQRPAGLSGQEEEDLRTLEKGYDPQAGALPDPDPHDDPTRKPGDDAVPVQRGPAAGTRDDAPPRQPDDAIPTEPPGASRPLGEAGQRGLLPPDAATTPPMDRPDTTSPGPTNLDPDPARGRP